MSGTSWFETRKVAIISKLENMRRGTLLLMDKADGEQTKARLTAEMSRLDALIAKRKESVEHHVTVRHIGGESDPHAFELLDAAEIRAHELAKLRARKIILDCGGTPDAESVNVFIISDVEWVKQQSKLARDWIVAGLVNGEAEYTRLFTLGGPSLLSEAVDEVKTWQNVSFSQGEV